MRKIVWYPGKKYYRAVPVLVIGYMAIILVLTLAGLSKAISTMTLNGSVVVVDPGHGGYDPGAITREGVYEKHINLLISKKLKNQLELSGAKVVMTREDDRDYAGGDRGGRTRKQTDLDYRISLAEKAGAKILVSIHLNAVPGSRKSGAETFYQQGSEQGKVLADCIQDELRKVPTMNKRIAKPGEFYLTRKPKITAVIVELGYLSNPAEKQKLQQDGYQDELAKAVTRGVVRYIETQK